MASLDLQQERTESAPLINELSSSLTNAFLRGAEYEVVHAIMMHWEDDDMNAILEIQKLKTFFEDTWHFDTSIVSIPSQRSQAALLSDLSQLIFTYGASQRSLIIIYYGGHGDANTEQKKAVWAAHRKGGPTLNWYEVQPTVFSAEGDVLIILDCCYAAQAARGRQNRVIELLAASGIKQMTPPPGDYSFTAIFSQVMRRMLQEKGYVVIHELYKRLFQDTAPDEELCEQPFHFFLAESDSSIVLRPMKDTNPIRDLPEPKPMALLSLTISLSERPDKSVMRRLSLWLKTAAPRDISAIAVDDLLIRTESIQALLQHGRTHELKDVIAEDLQDRNQVESLTFCSSGRFRFGEEKGSIHLEAQAMMSQIQNWNDQVYQSLQSNLLLNPVFAATEQLERLQLDEPARALGLSEAARLRILNSSSSEDVNVGNMQALPHGLVSVKTRPRVSNASKNLAESKVFNYASMGDELVIIEYKTYGEKESSYEKTALDVKRIAVLLREATEPAFNLAPFIGYIHEPSRTRFGLVFRIPVTSTNKKDIYHTSLYDEYIRAKWVPLNVRFSIAVNLARILSTLHAVGWLHKSFCSENILFFEKETVTSTESSSRENHSAFDLCQPRLFGFDLSRPVSKISDDTREFRPSRLIYTHPKRWGRPAEVFDKMHDIYALGVTLLEVGCWRQASKFDRNGRGFRDRNDEDKVREELLLVAREQLPHMAGEEYSRAVVTCLDGSLDEYVADEKDTSKLHKAFGKLVLDILVRCASIV